jgi:hypothetical protein
MKHLKHSRLARYFKKYRSAYYRVAPLLVLSLIVVGLAVQTLQPFKSVEVAFTDAAPSGLAIVPASCPSSPDTGSCECGPAATATCVYTWVVNGGGRGGTYMCNSHTYSCPAPYILDTSGNCVIPDSAAACNSVGPPAETVSAQYATVHVGQTDDIHGTYAAASGDTLTATAINEIPPSTINGGAEFIAIDSGIFGGNASVQTPLDYSFTPTTPGTYIFLPYAETKSYTTPQTTDSSQWVTVVVTGAICTDGSAAPNNDPTQCTCAQGNTMACNNVNNPPGGGGVCPSGDTCGVCLTYADGGSSSLCQTCSPGFSITNGMCAFIGCPAGMTQATEADGTIECVTSQQCPAGYTGTPPNCEPASCNPGYICEADGNLHLQNASCIVSPVVGLNCGGNGCGGDQCNAPPGANIIKFTVSPTLVQSGNTTAVTWDVENVTACSVTGTNGDSWTGLTGTETSRQPITSQTIYTLHCSLLPGAKNTDGTTAVWVDQHITVNIVPAFNEN